MHGAALWITGRSMGKDPGLTARPGGDGWRDGESSPCRGGSREAMEGIQRHAQNVRLGNARDA